MKLAPGLHLGDGKYQLLHSLGTGSQAEVWEANQLGLAGFSKHVVLKCMNVAAVGPDHQQLMLREARLAAQLHHPNIVEIYDVGNDQNLLYIAMERIKGVDLCQLLQPQPATPKQPLPWPLTTQIAVEVCKALHHAHAQAKHQGTPLQIVHRDLKPSNILLSQEGYVKVIDFGIAKAMHPEKQKEGTHAGRVKGTPAYMSPEQITEEPIDARSDLFSLGVILYELLTGVSPFYSEDLFATLVRVVHEQPTPIAERQPTLPKELVAIVERLLQKKAEDRFPHARELQRALETVLRSKQIFIEQEDLAALYHTADESSGRPTFDIIGRTVPSDTAKQPPPSPLPSTPLPLPPNQTNNNDQRTSLEDSLDVGSGFSFDIVQLEQDELDDTGANLANQQTTQHPAHQGELITNADESEFQVMAFHLEMDHATTAPPTFPSDTQTNTAPTPETSPLSFEDDMGLPEDELDSIFAALELPKPSSETDNSTPAPDRPDGAANDASASLQPLPTQQHETKQAPAFHAPTLRTQSTNDLPPLFAPEPSPIQKDPTQPSIRSPFDGPTLRNKPTDASPTTPGKNKELAATTQMPAFTPQILEELSAPQRGSQEPQPTKQTKTDNPTVPNEDPTKATQGKEQEEHTTESRPPKDTSLPPKEETTKKPHTPEKTDETFMADQPSPTLQTPSNTSLQASPFSGQTTTKSHTPSTTPHRPIPLTPVIQTVPEVESPTQRSLPAATKDTTQRSLPAATPEVESPTQHSLPAAIQTAAPIDNSYDMSYLDDILGFDDGDRTLATPPPTPPIELVEEIIQPTAPTKPIPTDLKETAQDTRIPNELHEQLQEIADKQRQKREAIKSQPRRQSVPSRANQTTPPRIKPSSTIEDSRPVGKQRPSNTISQGKRTLRWMIPTAAVLLTLSIIGVIVVFYLNR